MGCRKRFEPEHGTRDPFDRSMVLLNNVVEILDLADFDRGAVLLIVALDGRFIGRTPVDGDLLRHAVAADRLGQESLGRLLIALFCQQEINGLACPLHGTIEVIPLAFDLSRVVSR